MVYSGHSEMTADPLSAIWIMCDGESCHIGDISRYLRLKNGDAVNCLIHFLSLGALRVLYDLMNKIGSTHDSQPRRIIYILSAIYPGSAAGFLERWPTELRVADSITLRGR